MKSLTGRAGAGSAKPCIHCNLTLKECMLPENFGTVQIDLTNTLEREAIDFSLDNPLELSRKELEDYSYGMKRLSLTTLEPKDDVSDYLHMHINVSGSFLHKIGSRIYCFGFDENPIFQMDNTAAVRSKIEQAEVKYSKHLKSVISSLPSLTQMPGNFGREFIKQDNRAAVLGPLPECEEKVKFSQILDLWEKMSVIHTKTKPTPDDRKQYGVLAHKLETTMHSMKWIKRWPNQFIRACHHNAVFLNVKEGTGSVGPHSTEPLECANHWVKLYDDNFSYKGDRQKGLKGVFKLRRLKSSSKLRSYNPAAKKMVQCCSVCSLPGHNSRNPSCPGPQQNFNLS